MALSLIELEGFRDELLRLRYEGTLTISYEGQSITYKSDADLNRAINDVERRIGAARGSGPTRQVRVSTSKGL